MNEPVRSLFMPLTLAVGFSMVASYLLSSTLVPVLSVWLMKHRGRGSAHEAALFDRILPPFGKLVGLHRYDCAGSSSPPIWRRAG